MRLLLVGTVLAFSSNAIEVSFSATVQSSAYIDKVSQAKLPATVMVTVLALAPWVVL